MRLGAGPIPLREIGRPELESFAQAAVAASFDTVWLAESRGDGAGGGLAAAALLAQVVPIRIGVVLDAGLYHPLYMAEDIAIADLASQGRIEILLRGAAEEELRLLVLASSGAHIAFEGARFRVPAHLEANQPAPDRLALNPRPAQPVVPMWAMEPHDPVVRELGLGAAEAWRAGIRVPAPSGRWPGMVVCPEDVEAADLLRAAGDTAGYFLIAARTPEQVAVAGRRLIGPLRMPGFPEWINQQ
jgi:acetyl esterase/lipase